MKKSLIFFSLIISGFYLTQAINLNLSSGEVLSNSSWQEVSNTTGKIKLNSSDINISGRLVSSGKICAGNSCLGECPTDYYWDNSSSSCKPEEGTQINPGTSCLDLYNKGETENKAYYLIGSSGNTFEVYCDMTTGLGGRTLVAKSGHAHIGNVINTINTPSDNIELENFSNKEAITTQSGTLVNEFKPVSTKIRFELPNGDNALLLSKITYDSDSFLGNRDSGPTYPDGDVENISGYQTKRTFMSFGSPYFTSIISFNNGSVWTTNYGIRYREGVERKSAATGPAYVYLR